MYIFLTKVIYERFSGHDGTTRRLAAADIFLENFSHTNVLNFLIFFYNLTRFSGVDTHEGSACHNGFKKKHGKFQQNHFSSKKIK